MIKNSQALISRTSHNTITMLFTMLVGLCNLPAQTTKLPDYEVSGSSSIQSFIYKKTLPPSPLPVTIDSLEPYLPPAISTIPVTIQHPRAKHRSVIHACYDSYDGYSLNYTHHELSTPRLKIPSWLIIPERSLDPIRISSHYYNDEFDSFRAELEMGLANDLFTNWNMDLKLFDAQWDSLNQNAFLWTNTFNVSAWSVGATDILNMNTRLSLVKYRQAMGSATRERFTLDLKNQHSLLYKSLSVENALILGDWNPALACVLDHPYLQDLPYVGPLKFALLVDAYRLIPSIQYKWDFVPETNKLISIINRPAIIANQFPDIAGKYKIFSIDDRLRSTKRPLDILIGYSAKPDTKLSRYLDKWKLDTNLKIEYDALLPVASLDQRVPDLGYHNTIIFQPRLQGFRSLSSRHSASQSLALCYGAMMKDSWKRLSYQPLIELESSWVEKQRGYKLEISFTQKYMIYDHLGKHLPDVFNLSSNLVCTLGPSSELKVQMKNLLNYEDYVVRGLPTLGIGFNLSVMHRF